MRGRDPLLARMSISHWRQMGRRHPRASTRRRRLRHRSPPPRARLIELRRFGDGSAPHNLQRRDSDGSAPPLPLHTSSSSAAYLPSLAVEMVVAGEETVDGKRQGRSAARGRVQLMEVRRARARGDELHGAWACDALLAGDLVVVGPGLGRRWVAVELDPVGDAWRRDEAGGRRYGLGSPDSRRRCAGAASLLRSREGG